MEIRLLVSVVLVVAVNEVLSQAQYPVNNVGNGADIHDVPVINNKPKKVIRYKLVRVSDEEIKKEEEAKKAKLLQDAELAKLKKKLFPCRDYSPICSRYKNIWNPGVAQCRDVWMQRNCRESCGLCKVPIGIYIGCTDLWRGKKLGCNACVHKWVMETCKSQCGSCDGKKGRGNVRQGSSSVFVGKKKSVVHKVKTVDEAVKNQHKPLETEETKEDEDEKQKEQDEKDEEEALRLEEPSGSGNSDEPEKEDDHPKTIKVGKKHAHVSEIHPNRNEHKQKQHKKNNRDHHAKKQKNPIKKLIQKHKKNNKS